MILSIVSILSSLAPAEAAPVAAPDTLALALAIAAACEAEADADALADLADARLCVASGTVWLAGCVGTTTEGFAARNLASAMDDLASAERVAQIRGLK